jgi:hypothetical protein
MAGVRGHDEGGAPFFPSSSPPWKPGGLPVVGGVLAGSNDGSGADTVGSGPLKDGSS